MKPLLCFLVVLAIAITARAENIVLANRVLLDATVRKLDAFTARIAHSDGTATVPAWELNDSVQRKAGFDPVATLAERNRRKAAIEAAETERQCEKERIAMEAAQKEQEEKERQERIEKETRARIAEENAAKEDQRTAGAMLKEALKDSAVWRRSDSLKRLHDLVAVVVPAYEQRSRALMMASPGDALAASGWQKAYEQRGCKPYEPAEFSALSQEGKQQIAMFVPELLPGSKLGDLRKEMDALWEKMMAQFTNEVRARRRPLAPLK